MRTLQDLRPSSVKYSVDILKSFFEQAAANVQAELDKTPNHKPELLGPFYECALFRHRSCIDYLTSLNHAGVQEVQTLDIISDGQPQALARGISFFDQKEAGHVTPVLAPAPV